MLYQISLNQQCQFFVSGKKVLSAGSAIGGKKFVISRNLKADKGKQEQNNKPYGLATHCDRLNAGNTAVKVSMPSIPESLHNQIWVLKPRCISSNPNSATPLFKTAAGVTIVPTTKTSMPERFMQKQSQQTTTQSKPILVTVSKSNAKTVSNIQVILGRHPRKPSHTSRSPNPIPMNLYRSYQAPEEEKLSPLDRSTTEKEGDMTVETEERLSPLNNSSTESEGFITVKTDDRISPLNKSSPESEGYVIVKTEESLSPLNESSTESEGYITVKTEERSSPLNNSSTKSEGFITVKTDDRISPLNESSPESEGYVIVKTEESLSPLNESSTESKGYITVKTDDRISPLNKSSPESEGYVIVKTEESLSPLNESSTESEGYITVKTDDRISSSNKSSTESEGYAIVKTEPHNSDIETIGGILDFDYNLGRGVASPRSDIHGHTDVFSHVHSGDHNPYTKVQESDAAMPQRIEQDRSQQFDIFIKSEPLEGDS